MSNVVRIPIGGGEQEPTPAASTQPVVQVDLAEQATKAAVGLAALAVESSIVVLRRISGAQTRDDETAEPGGMGLLAGAALGFAIEAGKTAAAAAEAARRTIVPPASFVAGTFLDAPRRAGQERIAQLNEAWRVERPEVQSIAQAVAVEVVHRVLDAVLDQLDLTQLVIDRVDLNRVIASVDLNQAVENLDIDSVVEKVDIDQIVDRLNVERVLARLDMPRLALEVIDQIDLPEIIRASTGTVASESVRVVRMQTFGADRAIARVVDRLLGRGDDAAAGGGTPTVTAAGEPSEDDPPAPADADSA